MNILKALTLSLVVATILTLPIGSTAEAATYGGKFPYSTITYTYGGSKRYNGNIWQGAYHWRSMTDANVIAWHAPRVINIEVYDVYDSSSAWAWAYLPCSTCTYTKNYIYMNQRTLDSENDFTRTKVATHEIGHAIGLDHAAWWRTSVMKQGHLSYNSPRSYDINDVNGLY